MRSLDLGGKLDGSRHIRAFSLVRQVVTFVLGIAVVIDALAATSHVIAELVVGLILMGYSPLDAVLASVAQKWNATAAVAKEFGPGAKP